MGTTAEEKEFAMRFIRYYSLQIYSVILVALLACSAIFVVPDTVQQFALAFTAFALLQQWEEDVYPGGFFDILFGKVICLDPIPSHEMQRMNFIYPQSICLVMVFLAYFGHAYAWLLTPIMWLGIIEGFGHGVMIPKFIQSNGYNPGKVTGLMWAALGWGTLIFMIVNGMAAWWGYLLGLLITLALLVFMAQGGMRSVGVNPRDMPKRMKARLAQIRQS